LMTGVVVNGNLYHLYICILLHYNSALLLTVDLSPSTALYIDLLY